MAETVNNSANVVKRANVDMTKLGKVIVRKHPDTEAIWTVSKSGKTFGCMVESTELVMIKGTLLPVKKVAFPKIATGMETIPMFANLKDGDLYPNITGVKGGGKIVRKSSHTPFYDDQKPAVNKDGVEIELEDGSRLFTESYYTEDPEEKDGWVEPKGETVVSNAPVKVENAVEA